jgi:C4-dicarboxylate-specific signal transduction histidine kinase
MDQAVVRALGEVTARIPVEGFPEEGATQPAVGHSQTLRLDLSQWLRPGDDLKHMHMTQVLAVPMKGRTAAEGALLLSGMRTPHDHLLHDPLRADDLLPIEMLTVRLQATRSQTELLEKLIDSEKFAGIGQLASNVTQQLNNPLTVILGYASLLESSTLLPAQDRKGVESILTEARRMRSTLETLSRIARSQADQMAPVSVTELLADMEKLYRSEFLKRSIEFRLHVAPDLPRALCSAHQVRQAVLHCLQYSMAAVAEQKTDGAQAKPRSIRLEATSEGEQVQILIAHSGEGFLYPERAFDPFVPSRLAGQTAGLGLSLCATILRDNNGRASAVNLDPHGAAILLELKST